MNETIEQQNQALIKENEELKARIKELEDELAIVEIIDRIKTPKKVKKEVMGYRVDHCKKMYQKGKKESKVIIKSELKKKTKEEIAIIVAEQKRKLTKHMNIEISKERRRLDGFERVGGESYVFDK